MATRNMQCCCQGQPVDKYSFCLPSFVIAGAQKSGSSALFSYLTMHPSVAPTRSKELHFFDRGKTLAWSASQLPHAMMDPDVGAPSSTDRSAKIGGRFQQRVRWQVTGEATPAYMSHDSFGHGVAALWPDARVILVLRDPVDRFYSEWQMKLRRVRSRAYRRNQQLLGAAHSAVRYCLQEEGLELRGDGTAAASSAASPQGAVGSTGQGSATGSGGGAWHRE